MKFNIKYFTLVVLATSFSVSGFAQITTPCSPPQNQYANPQITNANPNHTMVVGQVGYVQYRFANAGDDPIPTNTMFIDISMASDVNFEFVPPYLKPEAANSAWTVDLTHTATDAVRLINTNGSLPDGTYNDLQMVVMPKTLNITENYSVFCSIFAGASGSCVGDADNSAANNTKNATMFAPTTLPVNISNFSGALDKNMSNLTWTVWGEYDIFSYEVLRSTNAIDFVSVGTVTANNSKTYKLADNVTGQGNKFYYKLKINENSKESNYSKVVELRKSADNKITIYPNPTSHVVNISSLIGTETISVLSVDGREIMKQKASEGNNAVNIAKLANGTYSLVITNGEEVTTFKIVKN